MRRRTGHMYRHTSRDGTDSWELVSRRSPYAQTLYEFSMTVMHRKCVPSTIGACYCIMRDLADQYKAYEHVTFIVINL